MKRLGLALALILQPLLPAASLSAVSMQSTLLITEVQTEGATARDEFIEIHNPGKTFFNMVGYEIVYISSTGGTTSLQVDLGGASWRLAHTSILFMKNTQM